MFVYLFNENATPEIKAKFDRGVKCPCVYLFLDKNNNALYIGKLQTFPVDGRNIYEVRNLY